MDVRKFADLLCHPLSKRNTVSWNGEPKGSLAIHKEDINMFPKRIENNWEKLTVRLHKSKGVEGKSRAIRTQRIVMYVGSIWINEV